MKSSLLALLAALSFAIAAPAQGTITEIASSKPEFTTLVAALKAAGLAETLAGQGPFTVFAPTDEAFARLPEGTLQSLLQPRNKKKLQAILKYHVVSGRISSSQAVTAGRAKTLQGERVRARIEGGRLRVGTANVIANDVAASNGVIHVIDAVLMPPPRGRKIIGVNFERPGRALASQLQLDRSRSLVITKVTRNGPASRAGVQRYDIIRSIDGRPATSAALKKAKEERGVGGEVELVILRRGESRHIKVPIGVDPH